MIFELSEYTDEKYVMHCDTKEKAIIFTTYLHNHGKKWVSGNSYLERDLWNGNGADTCYRFNAGKRSDLQHYKNLGYKILEFDQFDWSEYTGENIDEHAFDDMLEAM